MEKAFKLVYIIDRMNQKEKPLGKKMLQKIIYLLQRNGVDLGYDYIIHHYGPYSSKLGNDVYSLAIDDYIGIDLSFLPIHKISVNEDIFEEEYKEIFGTEKAKVDKLIDKFSLFSTQDLELLTTIDFVKNSNDSAIKNDNDLFNIVKGIKGETFSDEKIFEGLKTIETLFEH